MSTQVTSAVRIGSDNRAWLHASPDGGFTATNAPNPEILVTYCSANFILSHGLGETLQKSSGVSEATGLELWFTGVRKCKALPILTLCFLPSTDVMLRAVMPKLITWVSK
eukprot:5860932-Amphidinium_carterae.1